MNDDDFVPPGGMELADFVGNVAKNSIELSPGSASAWTFPEPEGPMIAVSRPRPNSTVMLSRATTTASPVP